MGWTGTKNGKLVALAEAEFDVFLTADKNLRYRQNLRDRRFSIVVFPSTRPSSVKLIQDELLACLSVIRPGQIVELKA